MRLSHAEMRTCAITTSCRRWCWRTYWLLEQGSNLQALRHLINSQARLPIPPSRIRKQTTDGGGRKASDHPLLSSVICRRTWWNERDSNPHLPLARRGLSQLSYHPMRWAARLRPLFGGHSDRERAARVEHLAVVKPLSAVMAGLGPGHPRLCCCTKDVDARNKSGHDVERLVQIDRN